MDFEQGIETLMTLVGADETDRLKDFQSLETIFKYTFYRVFNLVLQSINLCNQGIFYGCTKRNAKEIHALLLGGVCVD